MICDAELAYEMPRGVCSVSGLGFGWSRRFSIRSSRCVSLADSIYTCRMKSVLIWTKRISFLV